MDGKREFQINIYGLGNGEHLYIFDVRDSFFERFDDGYADRGNLEVKLTLHKDDRMLDLRFEINGYVLLTCDRSLDEYRQPVETSKRLLMKFAVEDDEVSYDIIHIRFGTQKIDVAKDIYDYIGLSLPMKHLHPRYQGEEDADPEERVKLIYSTPEPSEEDMGEEDGSDPRWKALKDLRNREN